jgi:hypothetical protein
LQQTKIWLVNLGIAVGLGRITKGADSLARGGCLVRRVVGRG